MFGTFVVECENESAAHAAQNIGAGALEEAARRLLGVDSPPAVQSRTVENVYNRMVRSLHNLRHVCSPFRPLCIIMRRRTVSQGKLTKPADTTLARKRVLK